MRVFVLLFNARTDNEGIHTLQTNDRNTVLLFKSEDDATRYALMLEAQDFPTPSVEAMDSEEIVEFCRGADYDWKIVEPGSDTLEIPPEENVAQPDWDPNSTPEDRALEPLTDSAVTQEDPEMSATELERIRRQLEGLL